MGWSYRQDGIDEVYSSKPGVTLIEGQTLPSTPSDPGHAGDMLEPATPPTETSSNLQIANAGTIGVDGTYANLGNGVWNKSSTLLFVERSTSYPVPDVPYWIIRQDTNVLYHAEDCPLPWDAAWVVSSFGTAPVPTVSEMVARTVKP